MKLPNYIELTSEKFNEFLMEALPKHQISDALTTELTYQKFHNLNSYKKNYINDILNNYYGMHYSGLVSDSEQNTLKYKLSVVDKKLCTFFLIKYGGV